MKLVKIEFYSYKDVRRFAHIDLDDLCYIEHCGYNYWDMDARPLPTDVAFEDNESIRLVLKSGKDFYLTYISSRFILDTLNIIGQVPTPY